MGDMGNDIGSMGGDDMVRENSVQELIRIESIMPAGSKK